MSSVIQALKDIEKAIKAQGGGSGGGGSDSGDEEESFPETMVVYLYGDAEDGYSVDENYLSISQALVYDLRQVVVVADGSRDGEHYYYFNTSSDDFDGGTDEDGIESTYTVNYYEFRALPDGSGVDYVKIYHNDDSIEDQLQGFSEVVKGRYTFGA